MQIKIESRANINSEADIQNFRVKAHADVIKFFNHFKMEYVTDSQIDNIVDCLVTDLQDEYMLKNATDVIPRVSKYDVANSTVTVYTIFRTFGKDTIVPVDFPVIASRY